MKIFFSIVYMWIITQTLILDEAPLVEYPQIKFIISVGLTLT